MTIPHRSSSEEIFAAIEDELRNITVEANIVLDSTYRGLDIKHDVTITSLSGTEFLSTDVSCSDQNNKGGLIKVTGATLELNGLTLKDACVYRNGGAIQASDATLILRSCTLIDNQVQWFKFGAGIWASNSELLLIDSVFDGNEAGLSAARYGASNEGGALWLRTCTATVAPGVET